MNRRLFLSAILSACAAPAIVRASSLMPIFCRSESGILLPDDKIRSCASILDRIIEITVTNAGSGYTEIPICLRDQLTKIAGLTALGQKLICDDLNRKIYAGLSLAEIQAKNYRFEVVEKMPS